MKRFVVAAPLLLAGGLTLAACGDDDEEGRAATSAAPVTAAAGSPASAAPAAEAEFNDADVEFAQSMIVHHEQAIQMAEIAEQPARQAGPGVLDLASRIKAAQQPEIDTMTGWLTAWQQPVEMEDGGHEMSEMSGSMSSADMDGLTAATGAEFDEMFLTMMIEHHQGAIDMANAVQSDGVNPDVQELAAQIVTVQQAEIDEMNTLLGK